MFKINNFNAGTRISGGYFFILIIVIIFSVWISIGVKTIQKDVQIISQELVPRDLKIVEWQEGMKSILQMEMLLLLASGEIEKQIRSELNENEVAISVAGKNIASSVSSDEGKRLLGEIKKRKGVLDEILRRAQSFNEDNEGGKYNLINLELKPAINQYLESINNLAYYEKNELENEYARIESVSANILAEVVILSLIIFIVGLGVSWLITRSITRPLHTMTHLTREIASGNLSVEIEPGTRDEFGVLMGSFREMVDSVGNIIRQVQNGSDTIVRSASEIKNDSSRLAERTEEQAATVEEIASALEELTSTIENTASNTRQAQQYMSSTVSLTRKSNEVISDVCLSMDKIYDLSSKMTHIIQTVDSISFQTNILALNAAVEAARAGESGRGFAVVAGEVRALAQRCASAANETRELIDESAICIIAGRDLAEKAGSDMSVMVDNIQKMMQWMEDISQACHEQSSGVSQLNSAMSQIDTTTQQNAVQVEESQVLVASLQEQSQRLLEAIKIFTLADCNQKIETSRPSGINKQSDSILLSDHGIAHISGLAVKKADDRASF